VCFVRAIKRSSNRGAFGTNISQAVPALAVGKQPMRRNSSPSKIFMYDHNSDRITQRRHRSALPQEYYESDEEKDNESDAMTDVSNHNSSARPFLLADIGEGIAEVELLRWFVKEGQTISEFDPVCEVQSDKATVEITSRYEGTVQKLAYSSTGSMIQVGEPILWILEKGGEGPPQHDSKEKDSKQEHIDATPKNDDPLVTAKSLVSNLEEQELSLKNTTPTVSEKVLTSPAVRKLARDYGLDLCTIKGTGPAGRILKGDVLATVQHSNSCTETNDSLPPDQSGTAACTDTVATKTEEKKSPLEKDIVVPLRGYNRIMADTMTASLNIPHMVYSDEINLNRFVHYKMEQQQLEHQNHHVETSKKLLFLPLAIKAASKALDEYPWLNASFDETKHEATLWKDHNIGIAMDTPRGLIVPVIKKCQNKSLPEIAEELTQLKASVMEGGRGLKAKDLTGATFTLSNVGAIGGGGTYMSPIITPPQVAIGALGQIQRLPRFVMPSSTDPAQSQNIEEAHICAVSWAADHRIVDGATVARFHKAFKNYLEDPIKLLLELR